MVETWAKIGFFAFVLAPVWATFLVFIFGSFIKIETLKKALTTLFLVTALLTIICDFVFLMIGFISGMTGFIATWNFLWHGVGAWLWIWFGAGYLLATAGFVFGDSCDDEYVKSTFICTFYVAVIFFIMLFLIYVANAVAAGLPLG